MVIVEDALKIPVQNQQKLNNEIERLYSKLNKLGWTKEVCEQLAPFTLRINTIKKEKGIKILAHSYQSPEIIFGIADVVGDSLGLAKIATEIEEESIMFCGVDFMAETVKILNPEKTVYVPQKGRDCTLADSITGEDVMKLKEKHPGVPVVCYVNTTAEVKAESDICCTSANAKRIIEKLESDTIIFVPDHNMGVNLAKITGKNIITWEKGFCRTHHAFTEKRFDKILEDPEVKTFAHLECRPEIIQKVDLAGGTGDMHRYAKESKNGHKILFLTEQGFIDRMKVEYPHLSFQDSHMICVSMKRNDLYTTLIAIENPTSEHTIELEEEVRLKAYKAVNNMLKY
ncbi:MAG: quinolinate synthase NadA [Candidatus Heimdallarchaeota archaeon]|nr:quinolinate synthase NadA [Candidatus Heimdallarchaeota archaeon]MCK4878466.1 quinolinate synthase NadA [Candidatus Heimdallarchaeota archaeon]